MKRGGHLLVLAVLSWVAGCTSVSPRDGGAPGIEDPVASEPEPASPIFGPMTLRGHVTIGQEVRSFTPCDADVMYWLVDRTDGDLRTVYESLATQPYQPVFAVVEGGFGATLTEGFGADYSGQLIVNKVRRAELEGHGCDEDLEGLAFRARGNEPFWTVGISPDAIRLTEFGGSAPESWSIQRAVQRSAEWQYIGSSSEGTIRVTIRDARCRDSMSGAYFSFVADIAVGSRTLHGCAVGGG